MKKAEWKKISRFKGPEQSPGFLLWQVSTDWRRRVEAALAALNLTHPQFVILASVGWLTREGSRVTQVELARHCKTDITMTSQILRTLEKKGYIERFQLEGNDRSKFPRLTEKGADLVKKAIRTVESVDLAFFGNHPEKCVDVLRELV